MNNNFTKKQKSRLKKMCLALSITALLGALSACGDSSGEKLNAEIVNKELTEEQLAEMRANYFVVDNLGRLIEVLENDLETLVVPEGVVTIEEKAFKGCNTTKKVILPNSLKVINEKGMTDMISLEEVVIPDTVSDIKTNAFSSDSIFFQNLKEEFVIVGDGCLIKYNGTSKDVVIPSGVKQISAKIDGSDIETLVIPEGVEHIGSSVGESLRIREIIFPETLLTIGSGAFSRCGLLKSVIIPENVQYVDSYAFGTNGLLEKVLVENPETEIRDMAFRNTLCEIFYGDKEGYEAIEVKPYQETDINTQFFVDSKGVLYGNRELIGEESLTIPSGTIKISDEAFYEFRNLKEIIIPDTVEEIGKLAFAHCTSLTNVVIGNSLKVIGIDAFSEVPWYQDLDDEFVILGDGLLLQYNGTDTNVVIPDGVKYIDNAFERRSDITNISIPEGVISLYSSAFLGCRSITNIVLPSTLEFIGSSAFSGCTSLTNVVLPSSLEYIGVESFKKCTNLKSITIPANVSGIGSSAFLDCSELSDVVIENPELTFDGAVFRGTPYGETLYY